MNSTDKEVKQMNDREMEEEEKEEQTSVSLSLPAIPTRCERVSAAVLSSTKSVILHTDPSEERENERTRMVSSRW